jgi:hypothetical protein
MPQPFILTIHWIMDKMETLFREANEAKPDTGPESVIHLH